MFSTSAGCLYVDGCGHWFSSIFCKGSTDFFIFFALGVLSSSTGKSFSSFHLKISGPFALFPSRKWQLHTLTVLSGSLSFLLNNI